MKKQKQYCDLEISQPTAIPGEGARKSNPFLLLLPPPSTPQPPSPSPASALLWLTQIGESLMQPTQVSLQGWQQERRRGMTP